MTTVKLAIVASGTVIFVSSAEAASFTQIRIGDVDGFGYGDGAGYYNTKGKPVNVDGLGVLSSGDFLADRNQSGLTQPYNGDNFDYRSMEEKNNTAVTGSGFTNNGTKGSRFTDVSLSEGYKPNGEKGLIFHKANFVFDFFVDSADIIADSPLFLNFMYGDLGVPGKVKFTRQDGSKFVQSLAEIDHDNQDGQILGAFAEIAFNDIFSLSEDGTGYDGYLELNFTTSNGKLEPYIAIDYVEISTTPFGEQFDIPSTDIPEPTSVLSFLAFGAFGASLLRQRKQTKKAITCDNS
ncbi:MAG: PEP-CTERM sorting domain-containing protein [Oscillatoria sp. PMC 1050.18]|nr:PEP-CTERM sorting domain-containing protein [Oscillatoria sp. PMC 1050.18]